MRLCCAGLFLLSVHPVPPGLRRARASPRFYDVELGKGALADQGERVVVHYEARWRGVTFMTSRTQWGGVTGGQPLGFDVGAKGAGGTLPGLDLARFSARSACSLRLPWVPAGVIALLACRGCVACASGDSASCWCRPSSRTERAATVSA